MRVTAGRTEMPVVGDDRPPFADAVPSEPAEPGTRCEQAVPVPTSTNGAFSGGPIGTLVLDARRNIPPAKSTFA
jgi:hypothetical protein